MTETKILIVGAGAQAKYIIDTVSYFPSKKIIGIVDIEDNPDIHGREVGGIEIIGTFDSIIPNTDRNVSLILAYGNNRRKAELASELRTLGFEFETVIHPQAAISRTAVIGDGTIVNANAAILPSAKIGNHVVIHSNVVVEHDNVLEDFVNLAPGAILAGYVTVREGAYIYTGANIIPGITVGKHSIVGAGATVIRDVPDNVTVVGVPARILEE